MKIKEITDTHTHSKKKTAAALITLEIRKRSLATMEKMQLISNYLRLFLF